MGEITDVKVVLLGNSGVGKSSLCSKWVDDKFDPQNATTIGSHLKPKKIKLMQREVTVTVWDTAGQEQYKSLVPLYTRSASCAIIVGDVNDESSFEDTYVWQSLVIESNNECPPLILALNKVDLLTDELKAKMEGIVSKYSQDYDGLCLCSAKTGEGVDHVFEIAATKAVEFADKMKQQQDATNSSTGDNSLTNSNKGKKSCC
ncbi:small GTP-binding protein, putative [Trichomonas vaginalis G3]|uniref:Small GTP-binding protein, putative n=2 Tax=Trichomonas vaginalis TaxID=5722 RepID=A0A8U0WQ06_TRIV3|nr:small Rab GTPase RabX16 [Trichomonas vaginalis G3]AAX97491.1 small Rab GTPase RabX16 [Trichomonas vaginalis]EAX88314.1 small GTP-binding protein, putative [Trichomonas vaginalis G3]KAI5530025.1 small Rab GTPase RabX16 [Trichomonas vaginalis G3]|eukprot:XP_001301244.1 small GTP-binding protein [Trichomonas vaginalis G3]